MVDPEIPSLPFQSGPRCGSASGCTSCHRDWTWRASAMLHVTNKAGRAAVLVIRTTNSFRGIAAAKKLMGGFHRAACFGVWTSLVLVRARDHTARVNVSWCLVRQLNRHKAGPENTAHKEDDNAHDNHRRLHGGAVSPDS